MSPKISCVFVSVLVLFLAIQPFTIHSRSLKSTNPGLTSFQNLEGAIKGQTKQGIKGVKRYLKAFGYLEYEDGKDAVLMDNRFDETLETALESYQKFHHLKVTGKLDADTVKQMSIPRCGMPDLVHPKKNATKPGKFHTVEHYSFFPNKPKWPPTQTHLTYTFGSLIDAVPLEELRGVCARAFQRWADVSAFTFEEASSGQAADIAIGFYSGDHGDGYPFDVRTLAHAFAPTDGRFHYDADEQWSTNPSSGQHDLESLAVHEIGHLLGLHHSEDVNAIMYGEFQSGTIKRDLQQDDINGIRALYPEQ